MNQPRPESKVAVSDSPKSLARVLPNAITLGALGFGMTSFLFAADGNFASAIASILLAAILDSMDGRVARMTGYESKMGAELDSLADMVCFGAAPAFLMYKWGLQDFGSLGWIACLTLAAAAALRLARFNVTAGDPDRPSWAGHYFVGVPAPAGAFLALLPLYAASAGLLQPGQAKLFALFAIPAVAALMVSTCPTFSAKALSRKAFRIIFLPALATSVLAIYALWVVPWALLSLCCLAYLLTLPLSRWRFAMHENRSKP
jgi:CDP-diacylglycerol---serine O-phosphatidyltransferase